MIGLKKTVFAGMALPAAYAQSPNLQGAISSLEDTSRTVLLVLSSLFLLAGIALSAAGGFIYFKKIKGAYKPATVMKAAAFGLGGLGLIALLAGILGFAMFLLAQALIRGLISGG
ncbi:hypothetical protein L0Y65_01390 [Candidatus Micrarchaeota archaeon]|nr:hypothetical protein [Candidatus Micrarchaeota archaeon]